MNLCALASTASCDKPVLLWKGVAIAPGLIALTRIPRPTSSAENVFASDRTAALLADTTLVPGIPSSLKKEVLRTMAAWSLR
jgi:hypothetical protein